MALIAGHSHDFIGLSDEDALEEASGSGNNSAEEFMNEMVTLWEEEHNETDYSSGDFHNEELLNPLIDYSVPV